MTEVCREYKSFMSHGNTIQVPLHLHYRRAFTFSCPVPAFLLPPLYPLQPRASSSGQQGADKKSCADKLASAGIMLALCSIPGVQSLAAQQCSERTTTIQKAGHAADQYLAPWLLGERSLKRFPALPLPVTLILVTLTVCNLFMNIFRSGFGCQGKDPQLQEAC